MSRIILSVFMMSLLALAGLESQAEAAPIRTIGGCKGRIGQPGKRARCRVCVRQGRIFEKQGAGMGFCRDRGRRARRRVIDATSGIIRSSIGCNTRIGRLGKRARCRRCVRRGDVFLKQGGGAGFCRPSRGRPLVTSQAALFTPAACRGRLGSRPGKRHRCVRCTRQGKIFQLQGAGRGFCRARTVVNGPGMAIRSAAVCNVRIGRAPKQQRCRACVNTGGTFMRQGVRSGFCRRNPVHQPSSAKLFSLADCSSRVGRPAKRARCRICVRQGGVFETQGRGSGFCRRTQRHAKVMNISGCNLRVVNPAKRIRCRNCVRQGGIFNKQGAGMGFCERTPGPKKLFSVASCNARVHNPGKRARCRICIRQGGIFERQGAGAGFCRRGRAAPPVRRHRELRSVAACQATIRSLPQRQRCVSCVRANRTFVKKGVGYCR